MGHGVCLWHGDGLWTRSSAWAHSSSHPLSLACLIQWPLQLIWDCIAYGVDHGVVGAMLYMLATPLRLRHTWHPLQDTYHTSCLFHPLWDPRCTWCLGLECSQFGQAPYEVQSWSWPGSCDLWYSPARETTECSMAAGLAGLWHTESVLATPRSILHTVQTQTNWSDCWVRYAWEWGRKRKSMGLIQPQATHLAHRGWFLLLFMNRARYLAVFVWSQAEGKEGSCIKLPIQLLIHYLGT